MSCKENSKYQINKKSYRYVATTISTDNLILEIDQLLYEKNELSPYLNNEEISKYNEIIDVYTIELLSRNCLNTHKYTYKIH